MSENTTTPQDSTVNDLKQDTEKAAAAAGDTWDAAKDKMGEVAGDISEGAGKAWDEVEDKAEELWDKAKSGELKEEAKEKLSDLAEGAKGLWNKLVDKLDGDDSPEEPKQA